MSSQLQPDEEVESAGVGLPVAPATRRDFFLWPKRVLDALSQQGFDGALASTFQKFGLCLTTDYSGMGCPEIAAAHLQEACRHVSGSAMEQWPGLRCRKASDCSPSCRRVLMSHVGPSAPACVFGDMLNRAPADVVAKILHILQVHRGAVAQMLQSSTGRDHARAIKQVHGRRFLREVERFSHRAGCGQGRELSGAVEVRV